MAFTFFFRDLQVLELAVDQMVKDTMGRSRIRVWDAGCAMGPELYTLLILLAEKMGRFSFKNLIVDATDLDEETGDFGSTITQGEYTIDQLKRIPPELFGKYFNPVDSLGERYVVDSTLRERFRYSKRDLLTLTAPGQNYSLIICKNVLLHFTADQRIAVLNMFHENLADNGIIAMEHTQKMPMECLDMFEQIASNAQVYRKQAVVLASTI